MTANAVVNPWSRRMVIIGGTIIFSVILASTWFCRFSPAAVEAHRFLHEMPVGQVREIVLEPYAVSSLADHAVVIRDRDTIGRIAAQLRGAGGMSPNHPQARWITILRIRLVDGREYGGELESTSNQGVLLWLTSDIQGGWNYGTYQVDGLGPLVEAVAKQPGAAP